MNDASYVPHPIAFVDLEAQQRRIRPRLDAAIARVLDHGAYIMGPEVRALEEQLAAFCGAKHAISCSSGTDALVLALMAKGLRPGEAVIVPGFTFSATAEAVCLLGAVPIFADVLEDTFNIDPASIKAAIATAAERGLTLRGVITVDLFGQPCDYDVIEGLVRENGLWLVCDAAQGFGAAYRGRKVGCFGDLTTTSFFPAKPLGCYGDGGAVFTDDDAVAALLRSLRVHGQGQDKYDNVRIGMNGRLDTIQAAILLEKLAIFDDEIAARNRVAARYSSLLPESIIRPAVIDGATSVWAQYTIRIDARDEALSRLKQAGVPAMVYYRRPVQTQGAYCDFPLAGGACPVTERLAERVLSLPMHPYLSEDEQARIVAVFDAIP
jgi:dTDP-4-amino-4,6-dideoxygalactose transaminase